ncbi:hypothetical protein JCM19992_19690 [Thermostilla marina]
MKNVWFWCALAALSMLGQPGFAAGGSSRGNSDRPNVVFIIADDMNSYPFDGDFPILRTPGLDKLARQGITFCKAYCAAPVCVASRAAVFSGRYPHHTGAYLNGSDPWTKSAFGNIESLPEVFRASGYTTFGRGKLTHAPVTPERKKAMWDNDPFGGGFGPFPDEAHQIAGKFWGTQAFDDDSVFPDVVNTDAAVDFLRKDHGKPFFLALGLWRPHTPFTAPRRFFEMCPIEEVSVPVPGWRQGDLADVPELGRQLASVWGRRWEVSGRETPETWRTLLRGYLACTMFADWNIGRLVEALDDSSYRNNTIVIFWSDNGYHCGEKNHWEKNTLWEQSARTPMIVRLPDHAHAGSVCTAPVGSIDLFVTLVEYCRLRLPKQPLDGHSLLPLLEDPNTAWPHPAITTYGEGYFSITDGRWRYIRYPDGTEELYDHRNDPHEFRNLAPSPDVRSIEERFRRYLPKTWQPTLGGRFG